MTRYAEQRRVITLRKPGRNQAVLAFELDAETIGDEVMQRTAFVFGKDLTDEFGRHEMRDDRKLAFVRFAQRLDP